MAERTKIGFNCMGAICVEGKVFSGAGEGAKFVSLPWVNKQITKKLGFKPYPGTLNIKLAKAHVDLKEHLKRAEAIVIPPRRGFHSGMCFKARVNSLECAVVVPAVANYPEDVIEILAPVNLREKFQLKDGDIVKVKILP